MCLVGRSGIRSAVCLRWVNCRQHRLLCATTCRAHGRPQAWERGGTCSPLKSVHGQIRFIYNILLSTKRTKIVATRQFYRLKIYLNCDCGRGSSPDPQRGSYLTALPNPLGRFKEGQSGRKRKKGDGEERDGEKRRGLTLSPCNNSCWRSLSAYTDWSLCGTSAMRTANSLHCSLSEFHSVSAD